MKKCIDWLCEQIHPMYFRWLFSVMAFLFNALLISAFDTDMHFLIATGREILENGLFHTNIWTIDSGSHMIIQQWLYCIALALLDRMGPVWIYLFVAVQILALGIVLFALFRLEGVSKGQALICIVISLAVTQSYLFSVRPELITIVLLLIECVALEKWIKSGHKMWLILLPIVMVAEINLHSSMWVMHFAILAAYVCPSFYFPKSENISCLAKWKEIIVISLIMFASMFANPYGWDAVVYVFRSLRANTFQYVPILELQKPYLPSGTTIIIVLCIAAVIYLYKKKYLRSVTLNITCGLLLLSVFTVRNIMFAIIPVVFLMRDLVKCFGDNNSKPLESYLKNYLIPLFVLGISCCMCISFILLKGNANLHFTQIVESLSPACDYLDENAEDGDHIFTGINTGAYLEYRGFKNIYVDARPELFTAEFTGDKNILEDYSRICVYGYSRVTGEDVVTPEDIEQWINEYDFKYFIIQPKAESFLHAYLLKSDNYTVIDSASCDEVLLFERTK